MLLVDVDADALAEHHVHGDGVGQAHHGLHDQVDTLVSCGYEECLISSLVGQKNNC